MPESRKSSNTKAGKKKMSNRIGASVIARYIRMAWRTNKVIYEPENVMEALEETHPLILSVWHGQFLLAPLLRPENIDARVLVAKHGDAALIGQVMEKLGSQIILGAGAGHKKVDKGGKAALVAALKALKNDISVVLTADVPPGPARKVGLGIITMAKLSGKPIVPVAIATRRYKSAKSWSRFTLNFPFTRQAVVMGETFLIPKTARGEVLEEYRLGLEMEMTRITERAYELAQSNAKSATPPAYRDVPKTSIGLKSYAALMSMVRPLAPIVLSRRLKRGKENPARLSERYGKPTLRRPEGFLIWFHCASVGETNAVLPLISDLLHKAASEQVQGEPTALPPKILLTTMTNTSANLAVERLPEGAVHQFVPLDVPVFVERFYEHWRPDMVAFVESEIWPNLVMGAAKRDIPLFLVNAIMSKRSFRKWRKKENTAQAIFGRFHTIFTQNEELALWYHRLGAKRIEVAGNLKLDAPPPPIHQDKLAALKGAIGNRPVFLAASTHEGEDEIIAEAHVLLAQEFPDLLTIIAPRHPERAEAINSLLTAKGFDTALRSLKQDVTRQTQVYIADTIGELGVFYSVADLAFIGGSLVPNGGQNPIEAIKLNTAVLTGPHYFNQNQYKPLLEAKAALVVEDANDLAQHVSTLFKKPETLKAIKQTASKEIQKLCGAQAQIVEFFQDYISGKK